MTPSASLKISIGLLAVVVLFSIPFLWITDALGIKAPSDLALLKLFHDHRSEFVQALDMAAQDSAYTSYFSLATLDDSKLSQPRQKQWKDIFKKIDSKMDVSVGDDDVVRFTFAVGGVSAVGPDWAKGITYIPNHQERYGIQTSDLTNASSRSADTYLRSIEPRWFCYYQRDE